MIEKRVVRKMALSKSELPEQADPTALSGALNTTRKMYRNPPIEKCIPYGNMMHDRRIRRGSTFSKDGQAARIAEASLRALATRQKNAKAKPFRFRIGTPPAIEGRIHIPIQTEYYLEELWVDPPTREFATQTDLFQDRPSTPVFVPVKTGIDTDTQIYAGDLFDFDLEVQPVVDVIVDKTIEQSLLENLEDNEIMLLQKQQREYNERRAAERAEVRRLEEEEKRLREEKERRVAQFRDACRLQKEVEERVAAAVLTHGYLGDFLPNILEGLRAAGYLLDNIKEDIENGAVPWLWEEINEHTGCKIVGRDILTDMISDITQARQLVYEVIGADEDRIPKMRRKCDLLTDSSDSEAGVLNDDEEWNILENYNQEPFYPDPPTPSLESLEEEEIVEEVEETEEGVEVEGEGVVESGDENAETTEEPPAES